jgi:hypothetical protein
MALARSVNGTRSTNRGEVSDFLDCFHTETLDFRVYG